MIQPKVKVRGKVNTAHVKKRYKAGGVKALDAIGSMIRHSAKREFRHRNVKQTPTWTKVGDRDGMPVLAMDRRPVTQGKVTSWKNPEGRGATKTGFLRTMIEYRRDDRKESVVIGPMAKATWLNKLQEFGGSARRVLKQIGVYPGDSRTLNKFKPPRKVLPKVKRSAGGRRRVTVTGSVIVGVWIDPAHTRHRGRQLDTAAGRIRPGRFMKKGLDKKRDRIAEKWRNKITGP